MTVRRDSGADFCTEHYESSARTVIRTVQDRELEYGDSTRKLGGQ